MPSGEAISSMVLGGERNESGIHGESLRTEKQQDNYEIEAAEQSGGGLMHAYTHLMPTPKVFQICN